ncbi:thiamine pyrophosphate-dependent enzyme [Winogradskyella jejuensis]|uniref:Pyruvate dehydrogenase (Quinone) n=1 Tax=Winogradskyella jejuensis TaxID=1089305 RepID=A0A1M5KBQ6_9FLAO|nr:thiamine pyrophosphate-dependent enzyme [Winogradskyella jejuensis]SHG50354.1 pyruvate dehydrogenase (quinone) [Winogradskyella jejuensis]
MNVSEQLLDILKNEGVKHIFGVAGDALNPLVTAIGEQDDIQWIGVNHEGNASYAAFAQGELGENFGVCASTVGPGALHLVNGLYNAKKERSPVIAITGQVPVEHLGTNYHQEADLTKIFDDICEHQAVIRSPEEAPRVISRAIRIAINRKCVCRIELPADIAKMSAKNQNFVHKTFRSSSTLVPNQNALLQVAKAINEAEIVGILAGAGCRNAKTIVLDFAKKLKAPITHSLRASDIFDHSTENVVGLTGLIGNPAGYKGVMKSDLLIMLGTDFPYTDFLPDKTKTVQIDVRAENIGNRTAVDYGLHGHIKETLEALIPLCNEKLNSEFVDELVDSFKSWKKSNTKKADPSRDMEPLHPHIFARLASDHASDAAIFTIDTGTAAIWASNFMNFHSDRRIIGSFNHGSMAVGLPAAIGAQLQYPNREVWGLIGDGAFNMSLQDFSTAVKYNLPIKIIVFNNSQLGFVKIEMEEAGLAPNMDALDVNNFNFADYAKLCGGDGVRVTHAKDIEDAIIQAKNATKPFIIDAVVTNAELALPPKIGFEEAKGFGISKIKELAKAINGDKRQWENIKQEIEAYFD